MHAVKIKAATYNKSADLFRRGVAIYLVFALMMSITPLAAIKQEMSSFAQTVHGSQILEKVWQGSPFHVEEAGAAEYGDWSYSLSNDQATITAYNGSEIDVAVPATVDGYSVAGIGANVFSGRALIRSISLPDTITSIGSNAFSGCASLASIHLPAACSLSIIIRLATAPPWPV